MLEIFLMNCITFTRIHTMKKRWFKYKRQKNFNYKKLRLIYDYLYNFEVGEEEKEQKTSEKLD